MFTISKLTIMVGCRYPAGPSLVVGNARGIRVSPHRLASHKYTAQVHGSMRAVLALQVYSAQRPDRRGRTTACLGPPVLFVFAVSQYLHNGIGLHRRVGRMDREGISAVGTLHTVCPVLP